MSPFRRPFRLATLASGAAERKSGHIACSEKRTYHLLSTPAETIADCIEGGADVNSRSDWMGGSLVRGSTPLHFASAWARDPAIVPLLMQAGAEVNARNDFRRSPLHEAAGRSDNPEMIAALVEAGAEIRMWTRSHHGEDLSLIHI